MSVTDFNGSATRFKKSVKKLRERWEETKEHWDDKTSSDFEEQYLRPILPEISMTIASVQRMAEMMDKAERDCDDQPPV